MIVQNLKLQIKIILTVAVFIVLPAVASADTLGQETVFNINSSYDLQNRKEMTAVLQEVTDKLYFYVDKDWWQELDYSKKQSLEVAFYNLTAEFERRIYSTLTSTFGQEPDLDFGDDNKITILVHPMDAKAGGYFDSGNLYKKIQNPLSNERKMVYLNSQHIEDDEAKVFLAHEFTHLITANQKNLLRGVTEDVWLNEARAEYSATLMEYNDSYEGSNLERRVGDFLNNPSVSLVEWLNRKEDYGAVNMFVHYLVDHYGVEILVDSLQSEKTGIESINYALVTNNHDEDFTQIFGDWAMALLINDCDLGERYCYSNPHLEDFRIMPTIYYLPKTNTILSTYYSGTYWAANWHQFIGGGNNIVLEFDGAGLVEFEIPYIFCDSEDECSIDFFPLDETGKGKVSIPEFGSKHNSLTLLPFISSKVSGFSGEEKKFSFSWKFTIEKKTTVEQEEELIEQLLAQIESLKAQIAEYQAKINAVLAEEEQSTYCQNFNTNLYFGLTNSTEVRCLQEFLKNQGSDIYPEGLVTGNFLSLTRQAVIRFQEKHAEEILYPLDLEEGTGYVGSATRGKINQLLNF